MSEACLLSPPIGGGRAAYEKFLNELREMNIHDPLVQLAIEDAELTLKNMINS